MITITTRAGKGSALTYAELDANFTALQAAYEAISAVISPVVSPPATGTMTRLAFSQPISQGAAIPAGTTLVNRVTGSTFTTTIPGITIDNASGTVSGTPTAGSGLIVERAGGATHNSLMFAPKTGPRSMKVGINIGQLASYMNNIVFLDYMKISDVLVAPATADANMMPLTIGSQGIVQYKVPYDYIDGATPSTYRLITDGDLDVTISGVGHDHPSQFTADSNGHLVATFAGIDAGGGLLTITRIGTNKPTYFHIVRDDEAALFLAGTTLGFKQSYVNHVAQFSRVRFMNWSFGNDTQPPITNANLLTYNIDGHGFSAPVSVQIDLCIAASVSAWVNPHVETTDAQFQAMWSQLDRLTAAGLAPAKIEFENEPWNPSFPQRAYGSTAFDAIPGPSSIAGQGSDAKTDWWYGYRSAQLAKLTKAAGKPYQHVIGQQLGSNAQHLQYIDQGVAAVGDWTLFARSATAPYSQGIYGQDQGAGLTSPQLAFVQATIANQDFDSALDNMLNDTSGVGASATSLAPFTALDKQVANDRGLILDSYEFNHTAFYTQHLLGNSDFAGIDAFSVAINNHPLTRPAIVAKLEAMEAGGVNEAMIFDDEQPATSAQYGDWGIYGRPTVQGILDYLARPYVPHVNFETVQGSSTLTGNQVEGFGYRASRLDTRITALGA